jgi:hypothetical protein
VRNKPVADLPDGVAVVLAESGNRFEIRKGRPVSHITSTCAICTSSTALIGRSPSLARTTKTTRLREKIANLKEEKMRRLDALQAGMLATRDQQISLTDPEAARWRRAAKARSLSPLGGKANHLAQQIGIRTRARS